MKRYVSFIKENKENEDFKSDYNKLKKFIVDFENGINVGFGEQFVGIVNRTPEDVKSISNENIKKMEEEKEQQKISKEEELQQKKQSDRQNKISVYLSQLLTITHTFSKLFSGIPDEIRKLKDTKGDINIDLYKNIVNNLNKVKLSKEDEEKIREFRKKKSLHSIPKLISYLNQILGVTIETPVENKTEKPERQTIYFYNNKFYTEDRKDITDEYKKNPDKYKVLKVNKVKQPTT